MKYNNEITTQPYRAYWHSSYWNKQIAGLLCEMGTIVLKVIELIRND